MSSVIKPLALGAAIVAGTGIFSLPLAKIVARGVNRLMSGTKQQQTCAMTAFFGTIVLFSSATAYFSPFHRNIRLGIGFLNIASVSCVAYAVIRNQQSDGQNLIGAVMNRIDLFVTKFF